MYRNELILRTNQAVRNINWLHPIYSAILFKHIIIRYTEMVFIVL